MSDSIFPFRPRYVVAFRTHLWDPAIAGLARRMADACKGGRFVVLADETNGELDVWPFEKVSHSADMSAFGLPSPQGSMTLWFNADYAIYALARAIPDCAHYIVAEYDVAVNLDLDGLMAEVARRGLDMVAHEVRPAPRDWAWYNTASTSFAEPWQALIPFLVLSAPAVARLLAGRLEFATRFAEGSLREWAYCEAFIASTIGPDPDMQWADLAEFAALPCYGFRPFHLLGEAAEQLPGTIAHPVLSAERLFPQLLAQADPAAYADPASHLRAALAAYPLAKAAPYLRDRWVRAGHAGAIATLREQLRAQGLPRDPALSDLAVGKTALQSAVCAYSHGGTPAEDAALLVSGELRDDYANHTDDRPPIWWMVDLGAEYVIDEVRIVNRAPGGAPDRFVQFGIDTSLDGAGWTSRYIKLDQAPVSADPAAPFVVAFDPPCVGRFVRINQLRPECLHLRRVQVFGRGIVAVE